MKRAALIIFLAATFCLFLFACSDQKETAEKSTPDRAKVENLATTPEDIKKEAADLAKTTMAYTQEKKELYMEKIRKKMAQYNQQIMELDSKFTAMSEQARIEVAEQVEDLNRKKAEMNLKVRELQATSGEAFEDLKEGMDKAMDDMDKAYEQAVSRFTKE